MTPLQSSKECQRRSVVPTKRKTCFTLYNLTSTMATQILSPDFGFTAFPRRSFTPQAVVGSKPLVRQKRVRFASQLTDTYTIANRHCMHGMSIADEQLCNQVYRIRRQLKLEKKDMAYQGEEEAKLKKLNEMRFHRFEKEIMELQYERSMDTLLGNVHDLDDTVLSLRLDMIRIKGLYNKLLVEIKTTQNRKNAANCGAVCLAQSLWVMAIRPTERCGGASLAA